jgi:serine/threonine-protein kinase
MLDTPQINAVFSHYRIVSRIGSGGMGEVWRARDDRLDRDVAIKVLPASFAADADRLRRFEQEARATSALNHPNILTIYDIGEHDGTPYIVAELLEGDELRAQLDGTPLPVRKSLEYARQIASGLAAAHERGIIHRDLKPENVFVTKDGRVKILDFGLAKLIEPPDRTPPGEDAPTRRVSTEPGVVMGSPGYMSPEQLRGAAIDNRSDIFAFGAILYEMLSGVRAFRGGSTAETISSILREDPPDISATNRSVSPALERIVRRCLEKNPEERFHSAGDLAFAIEAISATSGQTGSDAMTAVLGTTAPRLAAERRGSRGWLPWTIAAVLLLTTLALVPFAVAYLRRTEPMRPVVRFQIPAPANTGLNLIRLPAVAISPDGSTLVFAATENGVSHLYLRRSDDVAIKPLAGTDGASDPVFSPDGKWISFVADSNIKKVTLDGAVTPIVKVGDARGVTWDGNDALIYSPEPTAALFRVSASGGEPQQISQLDAGKKERSHRWPVVLPNGKAVLFTVGTQDSPDSYEASNIEAVVLATGERRVILQGASMARYSPTGDLIFARGGTLYAIPFDQDTLATRGTPTAVLQGVSGDQTTGAVHFTIAGDGTLAFVPGGNGANMRRIVWADRAGGVQPLNLPPNQYNDLRISPDGTRAALIVGSVLNGDVWVYDFAKGTSTRLTFTSNNASPYWSPDGKYVYYSEVHPSGQWTKLFRKPADGSRDAEQVGDINSTAFIKAIGPDGLTAVIDCDMNTSRGNIWQVPLTLGAQAIPLVSTQFNEFAAALSPDGRWLAYQSNESGRAEVYVRDLSGSGGRWQVSTSGGEEPHWSHDGRVLYYRNNDQFMSVAVTTHPSFEAAAPQNLFGGLFDARTVSGVSYDVAPQGNRFLMLRLADEGAPPAQVEVVLNWASELRK